MTKPKYLSITKMPKAKNSIPCLAGNVTPKYIITA